jgi:hypothetical protein
LVSLPKLLYNNEEIFAFAVSVHLFSLWLLMYQCVTEETLKLYYHVCDVSAANHISSFVRTNPKANFYGWEH